MARAGVGQVASNKANMDETTKGLGGAASSRSFKLQETPRHGNIW
jgi:hypothetical protein